MAVIINDLEVTLLPPENLRKDRLPADAQAEQQRNAQLIAPHNLTAILNQQLERACRVMAH